MMLAVILAVMSCCGCTRIHAQSEINSTSKQTLSLQYFFVFACEFKRTCGKACVIESRDPYIYHIYFSNIVTQQRRCLLCHDYLQANNITIISLSALSLSVGFFFGIVCQVWILHRIYEFSLLLHNNFFGGLAVCRRRCFGVKSIPRTNVFFTFVAPNTLEYGHTGTFNSQIQ
jgi:hypothetical protein